MPSRGPENGGQPEDVAEEHGNLSDRVLSSGKSDW